MKIYVASSWRNERQPEVVRLLREAGHEVYDFKNPEPYTGFAWSEIDPNWQNWTNAEYFQALLHPRAEEGFKSDFDAMNWADACVLVMPCGRSAHTEAGWMQGFGKPTVVLVEEEAEPELMYKIYSLVTDNMADVIDYLRMNDFTEAKTVEQFLRRRKNLFTELTVRKNSINARFHNLVISFLEAKSPVQKNKVYELVKNGTKRLRYHRFVIYKQEVDVFDKRVIIHVGGWWLDKNSIPAKWDTMVVYGVADPAVFKESENQTNEPHPSIKE